LRLINLALSLPPPERHASATTIVEDVVSAIAC
jgi:hypothetical protein